MYRVGVDTITLSSYDTIPYLFPRLSNCEQACDVLTLALIHIGDRCLAHHRRGAVACLLHHLHAAVLAYLLDGGLLRCVDGGLSLCDSPRQTILYFLSYGFCFCMIIFVKKISSCY